MIQQPSSKAQATQFNFLSTSLTPKIKKIRSLRVCSKRIFYKKSHCHLLRKIPIKQDLRGSNSL